MIVITGAQFSMIYLNVLVLWHHKTYFFTTRHTWMQRLRRRWNRPIRGPKGWS